MYRRLSDVLSLLHMHITPRDVQCQENIMKNMSSVIGAVAILILSAGPTLAASVGVFTGSRGNLGFAGSTSWTDLLTNEGHDVSTIGGTLVGNLNDKDVIVSGGLNVAGGATATAPGAAQTGEIAALTDWITDGGVFVLTGENFGFKDTYNTWLNPFGVNLTGVSNNFNAGAFFVNDPANPYLSNGVAGGNIPISNRGWYDVLPSGAEILAGGASTPLVFQYDIGAGSFIGIADTHFLKNEFPNAGRSFLFNVAEFAPGFEEGSGVPTVPLPAGVILLLSSLVGVGLMRRKSTTV
jgi:hypothetical protein